jgi:alpha-tubulin suppressor-like RCC1 family protein/microcystin-dependent protein
VNLTKTDIGLPNVMNINTTDASNITSGILDNNRLLNIPNAKLENSLVTIAGNNIHLGGTVTQDEITGLNGNGLIKRTGVNTLGIAVADADYLTPSGKAATVSTINGKITAGSNVTITGSGTDVSPYNISSTGGGSGGGSQAISTLTDVALGTLGNGDMLQYDSTSSKWKNVQVPTGELVPIGTVTAFYGTTIPQGWLLCDGSTYNTTTYSELFAFLGTATLPNLKGYFLRGLDTSGTVDTDGTLRTIGSIQGDAIRNIVGTYSSYWKETVVTTASGAFVATGGGYVNNATLGNQTGSIANFSADRVVPTGSDNRPKNIAVNYIIKARHNVIPAYQVNAGTGITITNDNLNKITTVNVSPTQAPTDTLANVVASSTPIVMTGASSINQIVTGTTKQVFILPDATLMQLGTAYTFVNNGTYPCSIIIEPAFTNQLISGKSSIILNTINSSITIICDGSTWQVKGRSYLRNFPQFSSAEYTRSSSNFFIYENQVYGMGLSANGHFPNDNFIPNSKFIDVGITVKDVIYTWDEALILTTDGKVYEWGGTVNGGSTYAPILVSFPGNALISKIYCQSDRQAVIANMFFAISTTGQVFSWGTGSWGSLGLGNTTSYTTPQLVGGAIAGKVITKLSIGGSGGTHVAALDNTGQLYAWGYGGINAGNAIGNATLANGTNQLTPYQVPGMTNVADFVASGGWNGSNSCCVTRVLKTDGTTWACGDNHYGELGTGNTTHSKVFVQENTNSANVVAIFMGACNSSNHTAIIKSDGKLYFTGSNSNNCFGDGTTAGTAHTSFANTAQLNSAGFQGKMLDTGNGIKPKVSFIGRLTTGNAACFVLDNTGALWACGSGSVNALGVNTLTTTSFVKCIIPNNIPVVDFRTTGMSDDSRGVMIILQNGSMMACGYNNRGQLGITPSAFANYQPTFQYIIGFESRE